MTNEIKSFEAKYNGKCCLCTVRIHGNKGNKGTGDQVVWNRVVKGQIAHAQCYESNGRKFPSLTVDEPKPYVYTPPTPYTSTPMEEIEPPTVSAPAPQGDLASIIAQALSPHIRASVDVAQVQSIVQDAMAQLRTELSTPKLDESRIAELVRMHSAQRIEVVNHKTLEVRDVGKQHKQFAMLMNLVECRDVRGARLNFWLGGPAGTGKTTAAENVARALGYERVVVLPKMNDSSLFFGYNSPGTGEYLRSQAREVWEHGGMLCLDDFDGTDPNTATELMAPFANHMCLFPDRMIQRHPDCVIIVTANTFGHGGTEDYVGRLKQDKAFLNRFVKVAWDIDENLERETCGNSAWAERVQEVRAVVKTKGIKVLITPRQSYFGAALLASGLSQNDVEHIVLAGEMTEAQWKEVR